MCLLGRDNVSAWVLIFFLGVLVRGLAQIERSPSRRSLRRQDLVPHLIRKIEKRLIGTGLYGSVWVDIEGMRSHGGYKGSGIAKRDLGLCIIFDYCLDVGRGITF